MPGAKGGEQLIDLIETNAGVSFSSQRICPKKTEELRDVA